jgi:ankyrin repeat protein
VSIARSLICIVLLGLSVPAPAAEPLDDARQNIIDGHPDRAMLTLDIGVISANTPDEQGYTLLHYAARANSEAGVAALLERNADPSIKGKDGKRAIDLTTSQAVRNLLNQAS